MATVNNKIRYSQSDRIVGFVNGALLCVLMFLLIYPMYFCLIASFSNPCAENEVLYFFDVYFECCVLIVAGDV